MIKVSADSTCDLSQEIIEKYDITISPLYIIADGETYKDGVDITAKDIFRFVDLEGKPCRTAAINVFDYQQFFQKYASQYEAVIHICIGSGFSSCFQNAILAARNFDNVFVIDSQNLSSGSGHIVYEAARMAGEGITHQEICRNLEQMIPKVEASFLIDRLDYLRKGGRCSAITAQSAKLLNIKPCIEVIDGRMSVGRKYHGSFGKCLIKYVRERLEGRDDIDMSRVLRTPCVRRKSWRQ